MRIEPAPLRLEGYYLKEISCSARAGLEQETKLAMVAGLHIQPEKLFTVAPYRVDLDVQSAKNQKNKNRYRILLKLSSDETAEPLSPYVFSIQLVGFFHWEQPPDLPPLSAIDIVVARNGAMILYSTAREMLASLTSRGPFPGLVLPAYQFNTDDDIKELATQMARKAFQNRTKTRKAVARKRATKKR